MKEDENIKNMWEQFVKRHYKLFRTNEEKWLDYLKELEEYIKIHNQLPNHTNKYDNISLLAKWTTTQKRNYVDKNQIMNNDEIRKLWEEIVNKYQEVFKTTEELWKDNLNNLKEYINIHNKLPTSCNQDETIKSLGLWTRNQAKNYDNKQYIMKNEVIQTLWEEFMKENKKLFLNNEELWNYNKNKVEEYIQQYSKLPAQTDKKQDIAVLGNWIQSQKQNYIKKSKIMIDETIRTIWEDFVKQYEKYFMSNEEIWMTRFDELNEYINIHKKIPTFRDKEVVSLVQWMRHQRKNYDNRIQIMKNEDIRKLWKEFTDNNTELFITADEIWIENKNKVEDYIQKYNKLPSQANKDKTISSLASWVYSQKQNYKNREHIMKNNNDIVKEWECFIEKHSILFMSNEEVWTDTFQKVCEYIDKYKKRPSVSSKDNEISYLSRWLTSQRRNYENKEQIMENEEIRKIWEFFVNKYQEIIMSNDELWRYNLNLLEKYIVDNNILPSIHSKISNEKRLGTYIHHQKHNHKYNTMKDASRRKEWEDFIEKYSVLFKYNE
jgi:glutaminase